jgi:hypothetical protein
VEIVVPVVVIDIPIRAASPAPWRADKMPGGYVVREANWRVLAGGRWYRAVRCRGAERGKPPSLPPPAD